MTKVILFPNDMGGCGHYRIAFPAQVARAVRPDVTFQVGKIGSVFQSQTRQVADDRFAFRRSGRAQSDNPRRRTRTEVVKAASFPPDTTTVVVQRVTADALAGAIPHWRAEGLRVVVDIDDDLSALHPTNPAFVGYHPGRNPHDNWNHLRTACREATLVTCTTGALAQRYAPHGRVEVIPNAVPAGALHVKRRPRLIGAPLLVGWTGTAATHGGDLESTGGGVGQALAQAGDRAKFRVVGAGQQVADRLGLDSTEATGWLDVAKYYTEYGQLDVAIIPLADTAFNEAKSDLKGLEACAVGVPFVASSTTPYRELVAQGVGRLARKNRAREWRAAVTALLDDEVARKELAEAGRAYAATRTFDATIHRWLDAWLG